MSRLTMRPGAPARRPAPCRASRTRRGPKRSLDRADGPSDSAATSVCGRKAAPASIGAESADALEVQRAEEERRPHAGHHQGADAARDHEAAQAHDVHGQDRVGDAALEARKAAKSAAPAPPKPSVRSEPSRAARRRRSRRWRPSAASVTSTEPSQSTPWPRPSPRSARITPPEPEGHDADRQVDEEDPVPAQRLGQQPARSSPSEPPRRRRTCRRSSPSCARAARGTP